MSHPAADLTEHEQTELMRHLHHCLWIRAHREHPRSQLPDLFYAHLAAAGVMLQQAGSRKPVQELTDYLNALAAHFGREVPAPPG
jgi:hypothetical protein